MATAPCKHERLLLDVSDFGQRAGYKRASASKRAATASNYEDNSDTAIKGQDGGELSAFPAPLVLPNDLLALEKDDDPQTLQDFLHYTERNEPTAWRKRIYLVPPPKIDESVSFMNAWSQPLSIRSSTVKKSTSSDMIANVSEYISAFYHGMPVKLYAKPLTFTSHTGDRGKTPEKLDLVFGGRLLDVRTRKCPDRMFERQLNLNDMIDVLIHILPADAYAIMMLVDHDVWEDDEDDFTCGRAYGGSRVSLVSSARYNPALDKKAGLDVEHAWPASHCQAFIERITDDFEGEHIRTRKKPKVRALKDQKKASAREWSEGPIRAAVDTFWKSWIDQRGLTSVPSSALWLSRVCKTVSHELGHCIGIDHCLYYACMMQGTCSVQEDARQPPYLCPVDEAKLLAATKTSGVDRNTALLGLLTKPGWRKEPLFAAYAAWIQAYMSERGETPQAEDEDDSVVCLGSQPLR